MLAQSMGYVNVYHQHFLLFVLPLLTAGVTTFYMFRMWFMTFTGQPRDHHVYEHARESPHWMTVPLIVLALFSVVVAWGWPVWNPEASWLEHQIHHAMPRSVQADFGVVSATDKYYVFAKDRKTGQEVVQAVPGWPGDSKAELAKDNTEKKVNVRHYAHEYHAATGFLVLGIAVLAFAFAAMVYYYGVLDPAEAKAQFGWAYHFLRHKWYFDELYSALVVRPALAVAGWARAFDTRVIDGFVDGTGRGTVKLAGASGRIDLGIIDGLANLTAAVFYGIGSWFRNFQTGYIRSYVVFLVVAAVGLWVVLSALLMPPGTP
jgi:NADH-quinone oxidoreductase subunit L